jgi:hypothetical protein
MRRESWELGMELKGREPEPWSRSHFYGRGAKRAAPRLFRKCGLQGLQGLMGLMGLTGLDGA